VATNFLPSQGKTLLLSAALLTLLAGCKAGFDDPESEGDSSGDGNDGSDTIVSFIGQGSAGIWETALNRTDSTFTLERRNEADTAIDVTVEGSYSLANSGFTILEVTDASDGSGIYRDDSYAGLQVGDSLMLIASLEPSGYTPLIQVPSDDCPSSDSENQVWSLIQQKNNIDRNSDTLKDYGRLSYYPGDYQARLNSRISLDTPDDYNQSSRALETGESCDQGIVETANNRYFVSTSTNIFTLGDTSGSGLANPQILLSTPSLAVIERTSFDGEFVGFYYDATLTGTKTQAVHANCDNGSCELHSITDLLNDTRGQASSTLALEGDLNVPTAGVIRGTFTDSLNLSAEISCAVNTNIESAADIDALAFIHCVGRAPSNNNNLTTLFLVAK
jgi:hypothetical protein